MNVSALVIKALKNSHHIKWSDRHVCMPVNDYNHKVLVQFNDGHIAISDGGSVHDNEAISLWKEIVPYEA